MRQPAVFAALAAASNPRPDSLGIKDFIHLVVRFAGFFAYVSSGGRVLGLLYLFNL